MRLTSCTEKCVVCYGKVHHGTCRWNLFQNNVWQSTHWLGSNPTWVRFCQQVLWYIWNAYSLPLLTNLVYKIKCLRAANYIYIGKTIRYLATRVKEHGTSPSAVSNHLSSCETCKLNLSCDSFWIIDSDKNDFEITIKEARYIKFKKPTINRQLFTQGSSFVLNVF